MAYEFCAFNLLSRSVVFCFFRRKDIIRILLKFLLFFFTYSRNDSFISLLSNFSFFIFVAVLFVVEILFQWPYDLTRNIKYFF